MLSYTFVLFVGGSSSESKTFWTPHGAVGEAIGLIVINGRIISLSWEMFQQSLVVYLDGWEQAGN